MIENNENTCENRDGFGRFPCPNSADLTCLICGARLCYGCRASEPACRYHSAAKRAELRALGSNVIAE